MVIISIDLPNLYSITLGDTSFYESSLEIKGTIIILLLIIDLPSLYSIELGKYTFTLSPSIVISSI